jgi:O-methyltransferase
VPTIPNSGRGWSQRVVRLLRALRLDRMINLVIRHAPRKVQTWAVNWCMKILLASGHRLVPEEALEMKYREAWRLLIETYGSASLGDYLEFGVCQGTSMACMSRALQAFPLEQVRLFGFDSFEGLPDTAETDDGGLWHPGEYKYDVQLATEFLTQQGVNWDRVFLIQGWFSETLNDALVCRHHMTKASVIMVDCDMYLSAREALIFCGPLIRDAAIIFFDDWHAHAGRLAESNMGEKRAFEEFLHANPQFAAEQLSSYHANAEVFLVTRLHETLEGRAC